MTRDESYVHKLLSAFTCCLIQCEWRKFLTCWRCNDTAFARNDVILHTRSAFWRYKQLKFKTFQQRRVLPQPAAHVELIHKNPQLPVTPTQIKSWNVSLHVPSHLCSRALSRWRILWLETSCPCPGYEHRANYTDVQVTNTVPITQTFPLQSGIMQVNLSATLCSDHGYFIAFLVHNKMVKWEVFVRVLQRSVLCYAWKAPQITMINTRCARPRKYCITLVFLLAWHFQRQFTAERLHTQFRGRTLVKW